MKKKQNIFLIISIVTLFVANTSYAAFPIHKHNTITALSTTSENSEDEPGTPHGHGGGHGGGHGHSGGHAHYGGHMSHSSPSVHWHGVAHHYHAHAYHYHEHYHHYHSHYGGGGYSSGSYSGNNDAVLGGISLLLAIVTPVVLLLYGSAAAIGISIGSVLFGGLGLLADRWKNLAKAGLVIGGLELVILAVLYALFII